MAATTPIVTRTYSRDEPHGEQEVEYDVPDEASGANQYTPAPLGTSKPDSVDRAATELCRSKAGNNNGRLSDESYSHNR